MDRTDCTFGGFIPPHGTKIPGVYFYVQEGTGRTYIGSTVNAYGRFVQHTSALKRGIHPNVNFQRAFDEHPHFDVHFARLHDELPPNETIHRVRVMEQTAIDGFDKPEMLLNIASDTFACGANRSPSVETRDKISKSLTGRVVSETTRQRQSESLLGHVCSDDTREKIRRSRFTPDNITSSIANLNKAITANCQRVSVGDRTYGSLKEAAEAHGLAATSVKKRILSSNPNFADWQFVGNNPTQLGNSPSI